MAQQLRLCAFFVEGQIILLVLKLGGSQPITTDTGELTNSLTSMDTALNVHTLTPIYR